jgi:hypothetical protein
MNRIAIGVTALVLVGGGAALVVYEKRGPDQQALQATCRLTARHAYNAVLDNRMSQVDGQAAVDRDCNLVLDATTVRNILDPERAAAISRWAKAHPNKHP